MTRLSVVLLALALAACDRAATPPHEHAAAVSKRAVYQCPMHPQIVRSEPGDVPHLQHAAPARRRGRHRGASRVPGHATFVITPERQQLIGVTHAAAEVRPLMREIRAAATRRRRSGAVRGADRVSRGGAHPRRHPGDHAAGGRRRRRRARARRRVEAPPPGHRRPRAGRPGRARPHDTSSFRGRACGSTPRSSKRTRRSSARACRSPSRCPSQPGRTLRLDGLRRRSDRRAEHAHGARARARGDARRGPPSRARSSAPASACSLGEHLAVPRERDPRHGRAPARVRRRRTSTRFEPRAVRLGRVAEGYVEVLDGRRGGRARGHVGELPDRLRVAPQGRGRRLRRGAGATSTEGRAMVERIIDVQRPEPRSSCCSRSPSRVGAALVVDPRTSRSTPSPTSPTPRSSSTRAGTAAPTSSRTRSPTRSSPRCSARRR